MSRLCLSAARAATPWKCASVSGQTVSAVKKLLDVNCNHAQTTRYGQTSAHMCRRTLTTSSHKMSFSNADTGSKPSDPYKEKNKQDDTPLKTKIDDLIAFIDKAKFGMMTTRVASTGYLVSRAMALAAKETGGIDLIFHTNTESGKTDDLSSDSHINIAFIDESGQWASVSGQAEIITDRSVVEKYYSSSLKAWVGDLGDGVHDGSAKDPRIGIIRVKSKTITYAVNHKNILSRGAEVAKGIVTGQAAQVNTLREITPEEINKCRFGHLEAANKS